MLFRSREGGTDADVGVAEDQAEPTAFVSVAERSRAKTSGESDFAIVAKEGAKRASDQVWLRMRWESRRSHREERVDRSVVVDVRGVEFER